MNNDDMFMAQFKNRFDLEPPPPWAGKRKFRVPWLEMGWALAAALMLSLYWTELRFGFDLLYTSVVGPVNSIPTAWFYTAVAAVLALGAWLAPRIVREL